MEVTGTAVILAMLPDLQFNVEGTSSQQNYREKREVKQKLLLLITVAQPQQPVTCHILWSDFTNSQNCQEVQ